MLLVGRGDEGGREADEARALAKAAEFEEHKLALPLCYRLAESALATLHFALPDEARVPAGNAARYAAEAAIEGLEQFLRMNGL